MTQFDRPGDRSVEAQAERIKKARELAKLTQTDLAKRIQVSLKTITNYESGRTSPAYGTFLSIAEVTGARYEWLIAGTGEMLQPRPENELLTDDQAVFDMMMRVRDSLKREIEALKEEIRQIKRDKA